MQNLLVFTLNLCSCIAQHGSLLLLLLIAVAAATTTATTAKAGAPEMLENEIMVPNSNSQNK